MFNFLFRRQSGKSAGSSPAATANSTAPVHSVAASASFTTQPVFHYSRQLEDIHYRYIVGAETFTTTELTPEERAFIRSIKEVIGSDATLADEIPRLPDLIPKLLKLLRSDDASWKHVVEVITQDSVLVAGVIKVANSPFYRLNVEADNLEQVVVQLGQKGVREVVMSVAFKPIMQFKGNQGLQQAGRRIWGHALKTAIASRSVAEPYGVNSFDAYLAGLVHNVGVNILLKRLGATPELQKIPASLRFKEQMEQLSKELTAKIVRGWNMPQAIIDAVTEQSGTDAAPELSGLGMVLRHGRSISMKHNLMAEEPWCSLLEPLVASEKLLQDTLSKQALATLSSFEF